MDNRGENRLHLGRRLGPWGWAAFALVVAAAHFMPWIAPEWMHVFIMIFIFTIMGQGWNVLGGYAGQFSFGHSLFLGIGAYTSSLLFVKAGISPWIGMFASMGVSIAVGLFIGYLSFRYGLSGPFFALLMLAFAEIFHMLAMSWQWAGGANGLLIPLRGDSPAVMQFSNKEPFYFLLLWIVVLCVYGVWKMEGTRMGLLFQSVREDTGAAESLGVNSFAYQMKAMAISAAMTAVGAVFYAQYLLFIDPDSTFGVINSVEIMLRPIIGGPGTALGPLLGAVVLTPLSEVTREYLSEYSGVYLMLYGAILVGIVMFLPEGLSGFFGRLISRRRG